MGKGRDRRRYRKPRGDEWERSGHFNRHHLLPRSRGGGMQQQNLLIMDTTRHKAFHVLFGNMTFDEAAALLVRCAEMKRRSHANNYRSGEAPHRERRQPEQPEDLAVRGREVQHPRRRFRDR